jgi:hypothetical protein
MDEWTMDFMRKGERYAGVVPFQAGLIYARLNISILSNFSIFRHNEFMAKNKNSSIGEHLWKRFIIFAEIYAQRARKNQP